MREFSAFEKKQIIKINNLHFNNSNLLDFLTESILSKRALLFDAKNKTLIYIYRKSDSLALSELFEFIGLLEYLKKNYLIFEHKNSSILAISGFVSNNLDSTTYNQNQEDFDTIPIPTDLYDLIQDYKQTFLVSGTELKAIQNYNFKTQEKIQFEKEILLTRISLGIAFIALLFSFLSPFIFDTTIDKHQFENIKNTIKSCKH